MKTITTANLSPINGVERVKIGDEIIYLNKDSKELADLAKQVGFDLQKRIVNDFEYIYQNVIDIATEFKCIGSKKFPLIITKSIFNKR